jgi:hypothetical protein
MTGSLATAWPRFAGELADALRAHGRADLAAGVDGLDVVAPCGCGDSFCQSFRTTAAPGPPETLALDAPWPGYLVVDLVDGDIAYVEVLYRPPLD